MDRLVEFAPQEDRDGIRLPASPISPHSDQLPSWAPDAAWTLEHNTARVAHCSLWWHGCPSLPGHRLGLIGHYAAPDEATGHRILNHACRMLAAQGCTMAVGPLDGSTWRRYRLIVERGTEPIFYMEPDNPDTWPRHFLRCGFSVLAYYGSRLQPSLPILDSRANGVAVRMRSLGVRLRPLDLSRSEGELRRVYRLSAKAFRRNFLYTPLSEKAFVRVYSRLLARVEPELVLLAEHDDDTVGFILAVPDLLEEKRTGRIRTVVIKTLAVCPKRRYAGLGMLMLMRIGAVARDRGYSRAIHALMQEGRHSWNLSVRHTLPLRRYALFAKGIRP